MAQYFSVGVADLIDIAYELDWDEVADYSADADDAIFNGLQSIGYDWNNSDDDWRYYLGKAYYHQYGTREATDLLASLSNLVSSVSTTINDDTRLNNYIVAITNAISTVIGDINNEYNEYQIEQHTTEEGTETSLSENTKSVIGDLMDDVSATFSVDDEISEVNTNDIEKLSDSTYLAQLRRINTQTVLQEVTGDLRGQIDSFGNEMTSYLLPSGYGDSFTISFGPISVLGASREDIHFTLTRPSSMYFSILHFCTGILKMIVVYICLTSIFHRVSGG